MASVADELRAELDRLIREGQALLRDLYVISGDLNIDDLRNQARDAIEKQDAKLVSEGKPKPKGRMADRVETVMKGLVLDFNQNYESWYSESLGLVGQVLPDRLDDFRQLYKLARRKDGELDFATYTLADYQLGIVVTRGLYKERAFDPDRAAISKFTQQLNIVRASRKVFSTRLREIRGVLQADLFDTELEASRELLRNGFLRAAGVLAGVVLERHLAEVARSHKVAIRSRTPTISKLNDALKEAHILDVPRWRTIQGLADLRNLCSHASERDPTGDEVAQLIDGVAKVAKFVS
jgi:hypothetical protein